MKKIILMAMMTCIITSELQAENMTFHRSLSTEALDFTAVEIIAGAGNMVVEGSESQLIEIDATVVSKDYKKMAKFVEAFDDRMLFHVKQVNDKIQIMAKAKKSAFSAPNIQINLQIKVPKNLNLFIDDGSGSTEVTGLTGALHVDDESGPIAIRQIQNKVTVEDGSGSLFLESVVGDVEIKDKAGAVELRRIQGDVMIEDGSGNIVVVNMIGKLSIDDGAGNVAVKGLKGKFKLIDDGAGTVVVNGQTWALE